MADIRLIIRYAVEKWKKSENDNIYRIYVTDCLKLIAENTAKFSNGGIIQTRYYDILNPAQDNATNETADEIINRMKSKLESIRGENNEHIQP